MFTFVLVICKTTSHQELSVLGSYEVSSGSLALRNVYVQGRILGNLLTSVNGR